MGTQFTRFADQQVLNAVLRGVGLPNVTWYAGLLRLADGVAAGTDATRDNVVELSVAAHPTYNRKPVGAQSLFPVAGNTPAYVNNDGQIIWDEAGTDWGIVAGFGYYDAVANGNLWIVSFSPTANRRNIRIGDRVNIPAQQAVVAGGLTI